MKRVLLGSVLATMALMSFQASADDEFAPKRSEVNVAGILDNASTQGTSETITNIFGSYGYYFTPQIVGNVNVNYLSISSGGTTLEDINVGVGAKYYFMVGKKGDITPWVEGDVGLATIQTGSAGSANGYDISAAVGGTYWMTENAGPFVDGRLRSTWITLNGSSSTVTEAILEFGVSLKF
ncbi:MAG TPA: hypothetical protein VKG67_00605 [Gallionellaceae bacterium]|nr:hypothetical protein [Gallionellaceae bacterium]